LADWLTSPQNPLTSRVAVNRIWAHLFGQGIVTTVDNFGVMGDRPSNPELLDYLAGEFIRNGWSTKKLVRTIVLTHAYRLAQISRIVIAISIPRIGSPGGTRQLVWMRKRFATRYLRLQGNSSSSQQLVLPP